MKIKPKNKLVLNFANKVLHLANRAFHFESRPFHFAKYGCINVHGSLLPKLRGGAPIHHAIINGESETGITIMYMDKLMDSGDIISQEELPILDNDNLDSLNNFLYS